MELIAKYSLDFNIKHVTSKKCVVGSSSASTSLGPVPSRSAVCRLAGSSRAFPGTSVLWQSSQSGPQSFKYADHI